MRIRQGNDFIFLWSIERDGLPEDLSNARNIRLHFKNFDCVGNVQSFQIVDGNIVRVEVAPKWASRLGAYRLILSYEFENDSYSDGDRKCVVDVLAFNIVPKTCEADDLTEMAKTTDIMIGLSGLSAYEVWLKDNPDKTKEDYYNWLQEPATDIAETVGLQEQARVEAEELRVLAEQDRQSSTQEAISNAENATENAETAAQNADDARLAIQDDLALKANHGYESNPKTLKEVEDNTSVKMTNLLQNSSFENGVIAPVTKFDGSGGASTLSINTINPISGNYDARLEVTTPSTSNSRPILHLNGNQDGWVLNHVFYFGMSVKVNSGTPIIYGALNGVSATTLNLTLKDGFNSWTVKCGGLMTFAYLYLDGRTLWDFNFDNLIAYDLTAIFGEGNEPTKEEMDLLISTLGTDYFEGEITIPAQKIMQWQLKLANTTAQNEEEGEFFYKVRRNVGIAPSGIPGYVNHSTGIIEPSTINLYRFLKIESGEKVVLKCRVGGLTSAISFAQDLEATTVVPKIVGLGDTIDGVYEYVATENGYVVISWHKDYPVNVRIYSQEDYNINQFSNIYFNRKPVDATFTSGYILSNGNIVEDSEISHYSSPILLHKGETIWVYSKSMGGTAIAITTENGETYKPVVFYPDESVAIGRNFKYTATEDVYVSVSGRVEGFRAEIVSLNLPKNDGSYPKLLQYSRQLETEWNSWETNNYSLSSLKMKKEAGRLPMTMGYYFSDYPQRNGKLYFSPTLLGKPELIVDFNDNSGLPDINLERSVIAVSPKYNSIITNIFDVSPGRGLRIYEDSTFAHVNKEEPMQAWLYNSGLDFVNDAEGNEYCIYGEYSHGSKPTRRIFKGNYPYSNPDNWRVVHTFPSDETEGSIRHIHQIQKDSFSDFIYCTTGDQGTQSQILYSADLGETWNVLIEDKPQGYLRMINFIFLENEIYWATDDDNHYLFRATRDENGLLDAESVELVANLPVRQSTNSSAYIKEKNCLFFYDRISPTYEGEPITTCIYDIEKKEIIEVGKLFPRKTNPPLGLWGNRGKCYVHYPNSADRRLAMGIVDEYTPCNFDFIGNDGKTFGTVIYELI